MPHRVRSAQAVCSVLAVLLLAAEVSAVDRTWQTGTWRDVQIKRPKVVFGMSPNAPATGVPRSAIAATQEERLYVIETSSMRIEAKELTTMDAPRIEATVGDPVTFALEKKTLYIKDSGGREHKLNVTKISKPSYDHGSARP